MITVLTVIHSHISLFILVPLSKYVFHVESAGFDAGNTCIININGVNYQSNGRGHSVVIVDMEKNTYTSNIYDTYDSAEEVSGCHKMFMTRYHCM